MLKRFSSWCLVLVVAGILAACNSTSTTGVTPRPTANLNTATANPTAVATAAANVTEGAKTLTYQQKAELTYQAITKYFYQPNFKLYLEHYEAKSDDKAVSFLWPYSGMISALNAMATLSGEAGVKYKAELKRVLDELEQYWDAKGLPPAYDSYVVKFGGGQKYYDDNEWLGLDFIEAYHTLADPKYLAKAKAVFDFAISGWSDDFGGGIYWRENDSSTKNTCSNGPAAVLALKLYQETGEAKYLDWAKKILEWVKQLKSPDSGVYWDHLQLGGVVDKRTYTYNTGTIIHSNALLYQITGDQAYLSEAQNLAKASVEHFARLDEKSSLRIYPDTPWFNAILYKGYLALYRVDPTHDRQYLEAMRSNLDYAWEQSRDDKGLFSPDWSGKSGVTNPNKWLLDQAPMAEFYALLAQYK